jgi:hypothetical protein
MPVVAPPTAVVAPPTAVVAPPTALVAPPGELAVFTEPPECRLPDEPLLKTAADAPVSVPAVSVSLESVAPFSEEQLGSAYTQTPRVTRVLQRLLVLLLRIVFSTRETAHLTRFTRSML